MNNAGFRIEQKQSHDMNWRTEWGVYKWAIKSPFMVTANVRWTKGHIASHA